MLTISQLWNTMYCGFLVWFFFSLKICTSQMMGIGLCSSQLAAPSGWQLTCAVVAAEPWWKRELWVAVGSASSMWHSVSLCPCCLSPRAGGWGGRSFFHLHSLISLCCCHELHPVLGQSSALCWHEGCHCFSGDGWAVHCLSLCLI